MIRSFKSNALSRYWTKGQENRIKPEWRSKVRLVLSRLDAAERPEEMNAPRLWLSRPDREHARALRRIRFAQLAHYVCLERHRLQSMLK